MGHQTCKSIFKVDRNNLARLIKLITLIKWIHYFKFPFFRVHSQSLTSVTSVSFLEHSSSIRSIFLAEVEAALFPVQSKSQAQFVLEYYERRYLARLGMISSILLSR